MEVPNLNANSNSKRQFENKVKFKEHLKFANGCLSGFFLLKTELLTFFKPLLVLFLFTNKVLQQNWSYADTIQSSTYKMVLPFFDTTPMSKSHNRLAAALLRSCVNCSEASSKGESILPFLPCYEPFLDVRLPSSLAN